jgi:hypothetical protein
MSWIKSLFTFNFEQSEMIQYLKITKFFLQVAFGLACIIATILWLDNRGVYDEKDSDHVEQRWESLYSLEDSVEIDVLMIGNSHAFTGVIPKLLSAGIGMTSFVLANNGTILGDSYWTLREAVEVCQPQLVLVETTAIDMQLLKQDESSFFVNQLRAFHARRNWRLKVQATPALFNLDDWATAWSPTVQNHHLFWTDPERMEGNIYRGAPTLLPHRDNLFLGRYSRFESGLTDSTVALYDIQGPTLDGNEYGVSEENKKYVERIMELAIEKGFEVAFVSTPMYTKHWENVEQRNAALADLIQPYGAPWLNLQADESLTNNPLFFENTVGRNQHLTILGSFEVTHRIIRWINENKDWRFNRPGWNRDIAWHRLFAQQDGYLSFFPSLEKHPGTIFRNRTISLRRKDLPPVNISEIIFFKEDKQFRRNIDCFAKVYPTQFRNGRGPARHKLQIGFDYQDRKTGEIKNRKLRLTMDRGASSDSIWLYRSVCENIQVKKLTSASFIPR